jgi:Putative Flp pilus-assembly TadE/G-like
MSSERPAQRGQILALFALMLVVLLGASALAVDYGLWLLTDRQLQNVADHAALAGSSQFAQRQTQASCTSGAATQTQCVNARTHAWVSLNVDLNLGLSNIDALATRDSPAAGDTSVSTGQDLKGHTIWVTSPPPSYAAYTNAGGRYADNFGIVFVRVDQPTQSFLGGVFGIRPGPRTGWATAGALPTDYALQTFCRNNIAPQNGVCANSAGLTIDGQGGITLVRGDIATNETLDVTSNTGNGVIVEAGNVFVVNGACGSSTWTCPGSIQDPYGGIVDRNPATAGAMMKNAFYMAPLPVPRYESPLDYASFSPQSACPTTAQWNANHIPCIPFQSQYGTVPANAAGDWVCGDGTTSCGVPTVTTVNGTSSIVCGAGSFDPNSRFMRPNTDSLSTRWSGSPDNTNLYNDINDSTVDPTGTLPTTTPGSVVLVGSPASLISSGDGKSITYRAGLTPPQGVPSGANLTVRYVVFRTLSGQLDPGSGTPNTVTVDAGLYEKTGTNTYALRGTLQTNTATTSATEYQYSVALNTITDPTLSDLYIQFAVTTADSTGGSAANNRGAGISWAQVEIPSLLPPQPPTIRPGHWRSITIPNGGCAVLDPSPSVGLQQYQLPGVFEFGGSGNPAISIGSNAFLIGDAVSLVFDSNWPDPAGNKGITVGSNGALVLNTAIHGGYNPSYPLSDLPYDAGNAAWQVDPGSAVGTHAGAAAWPVCTQGGNNCVPRTCYMNTDPTQCNGDVISPVSDGRGITFYFTPTGWPPTNTQRRFQLGGGSGAQPGIAFRGVLYAPYDDVNISGGNGFNTVGQVLAWTAKFNGGSASILLDYPYAFVPASPYLLEPTIQH